MKRIISLALAMIFVLIATLSVSAALNPGVGIPSAEQINNVADCKWTGGNGKASFGYDPAVATDFYVVGDGPNESTNHDGGQVWNWWATYDTEVEEDVISAELSPKTDIGIFFGATDTILTATNLNNKNDCCKYLRYYFANIKYDVAADTYTLVLLNDSNEFGASQPTPSTNVIKEAEVALDKTTYGINGTDDITLKVDFDKDGNVKVYVNGIETISKTGLAPYGKKCGVILPTCDYGGEYCLEIVATVSNFTIGEPQQGGNAGGGATDTGDATTVYLVVSALAVCATLAAVYVSRKKRIAE